MHSRLASVLGIVVATLPLVAGADPTVTLAVDCPGFDAETRAALEARAKAELLVRNAPGTFVVACRGPSASLSWHPLAGRPAVTVATLDADARASVERVLEALDTLLTTPAPAPAESVANTPAPLPVLAPEPVATVVRPPPVLALPPPSTPPTELPPRTSQWPGLLVSAGVATELWSKTAALGPRARLLVPVTSHLELGALVTVLFTTRSPESVSGRSVRIGATGDCGVDRGSRFRVGAGVFADLVHASATVGSDDATEFGAMLHATAALVEAPVRIELGPTLVVHPKPIDVILGPKRDGSETTEFGLHPFTAGLVLDITAGPVR
ncbi:MAG TPA: hypothetical protein VH062_31575 [Polyangiaceae bacterium]|jgi:hypothetical protein|nr:hypothetical protein [Polyangiaceae bacterium]